MSTNKYSIAIIPDKNVIETMKQLKMELAQHIGWYHSKNSIAHFTIGEFEASGNALQHIHEQIMSVCKELKPFEIQLKDIRSFDKTGTLFVALDEGSSQQISNLSMQFHKKFNLNGSVLNPHMSIGRSLKPNQLQTGKQLLKFEPVKFTCITICLRRLNESIKQYEIIHSYPLVGV